MKIPICSGRFILNLLLVLNIAAIVIVDLWYSDLFSLRWALQCALLIHLAFRFPEWLKLWRRG